MPYYGTKRKVFISFYQGDRPEAERFIEKWAEREGVFIPKALGVSDDADDLINSDNPTYVMNQIREIYLGDSTVTIVLVGSCTHSRRYVDWELKTTLRKGTYTPNGLMGIILASKGSSAHLPERFRANWKKKGSCYARYYVAPTAASQLEGWIDDAFDARTTRDHLIQNDTDMMKYNRKCLVCGVTH